MASYDEWLSDGDAYVAHLQGNPDAVEHENDTHWGACAWLVQGLDCTCATIDRLQAHFRNLEQEARGDV